jgi:hypothetical protein
LIIPNDYKHTLKPLPQPVYHLLSTPSLKEMCKKHGLPDKGSRESLIERHKELVLLYNA